MNNLPNREYEILAQANERWQREVLLFVEEYRTLLRIAGYSNDDILDAEIIG